jgi:hypothetical protein
MADFSLILESWDWRELRVVGVEDNVARFRNEFRDVYNEVFPLTEDKRKQKDKEKPWLDDPQFKVMVREKGSCSQGRSRGGNRRETRRGWLE